VISSTSTLLRLNTDWFIIFIECHYYVPPSLLTLLDGRQVQNPSTNHHYQTTQRFLAFPPLWLTCTSHHETRMLWYTYVKWWILYTTRHVTQVRPIPYRHTDSPWLLLINTTTLGSYAHKLNKNSPYYSHAPKYTLPTLPYSSNIHQQVLVRYNAQHRLLPMFQYLSGSPTQHLSLMAKHLLFRNRKHMLTPYAQTNINQSVSVRTRVSNPDDYTL